MFELPDYKIEKMLNQGFRSEVYRGSREVSNQRVVFKRLCWEFPTPSQLAGFRREFKLTHRLGIEGVIETYELVREENRLVMVLEDFGGESLDKCLLSGALSLTEFLPLAIRITDILGRVHQQHVIHKNITPSNIVWNRESGEVKIIDFGIAAELSQENPEIRTPHSLEGTLAYMSPEQTGRMNRTIDYRTDLYSLGCTFYEMLTGRPPFEMCDPIELVHAHIVMMPPPLQRWVPEIPTVLSQIVLKLLAKAAEERYQSTFGLKADLQRCLEQWEATKKVRTFVLGESDLSDLFQISQKLYGREREFEKLLAAFSRVSQGAKELVFVSGSAGVGKSALVREIHKLILGKRGFFLSGKFDQFKRNIPYSSLIEAFQSLVLRLLSYPEEELARWKQTLLQVLGRNVQVLIEVIPEIELIVGKQEPLEELSPKETKNRFDFVFHNFVEIFACEAHPLVLFFDDLQWADSASLEVITRLLSVPDSGHILIVGAFRDNLAEQAYALTLAMDNMTELGVSITSIELLPLAKEHIQQLIVETLHCTEEESLSLAELCHQKTGGNPFFLRQFLLSLYRKEGIVFDELLGRWQWDMDKIQGMDLTENVIELMVRLLKRLPPKTQEVLKEAACIGNRFDLQTLCLVHEAAPTETTAALEEALQEGLIVPLDGAYRFVESWKGVQVYYRFLHDRIQQAAYGLLTEEARKRLHYRMGFLLWEVSSDSEKEERLFEVVNHLNQCDELLVSSAERLLLAEWNLLAGRKARTSAAYEAAFGYFQAGIALLHEASWQQQHDLAFGLHLGAAEMAFLNVDFPAMERLSEVALQNAQAPVEKVKVYAVKIQSYKAANKLNQAVETTLTALELLGVTFPRKPGNLDVVKALFKLKWGLRGKSMDDLFNQPVMTDPAMVAATHLLINVLDVAYNAAPVLFPLFNFRVVQLAVTHGPCREVPTVYACYAIALCGALGEFDRGMEFADLAWRMYEQHQAHSYKARMLMVFNSFVYHWKSDIRNTLKPLRDGYLAGLEVGDVEYAVICAYLYCAHSFCAGSELPLLEKEIAQYTQKMGFFKQETIQTNNRIFWQTVLNLQVPSEEPARLSGREYKCEEMLPLHEKNNNSTALFYVYLNQLFLAYLFGEFESALENSVKAEQHSKSAFGTIFIPRLYFYDSLTRLALWSCSSRAERRYIRKRVAANQKKIKKWAKHSPSNYQQKYLLVEAEIACVKGNFNKAAELFDEAIGAAQRSGHLQEEALACELAARCYATMGREKVARVYLRDAFHGYTHWGAQTKVQEMKTRYASLLSREQRQPWLLPAETLPKQTALYAPDLDLYSVMKAVQAISSEVAWEKLLSVLMQIAMQNAGAHKALLFLKKQGELRLQAKQLADKPAEVFLSTPLTECSCCSHAIVSFVQRTKEMIVLCDALHVGEFTTDTYVVEHQSKSILCLPLLEKGEVVGIFYFENDRTKDAFTSEHQVALQILSSQAVISLENARLYGHLEDEVAERTQELSAALALRQEALQQLQGAHHELEENLLKLKETQSQMVHSEKMASLGRLVGGIAHTINNPANFVTGGVYLLKQHLPEILELAQKKEDTTEEIEQLMVGLLSGLEAIQAGSDRITTIIQGMRTFSRLDEAEYKRTSILENLQASVFLLEAAYEDKVNFHYEFDEDRLLYCWPAELNQVFLSIASNACEGILCRQMSEEENWTKGNLTIRTFIHEHSFLGISFVDDGIGIAKKHLPHVLEPFFSEGKLFNKHYGLGLSIAFGVIEKHNGSISLESTEGKGTETTILLPLTASASSHSLQSVEGDGRSRQIQRLSDAPFSVSDKEGR